MILLKKKPQTPRKWRQIKMKSVPLVLAWSKTLCREITVPLPKQQGKSVALICLPFFFFFFFFFFSGPSGLPEHDRKMPMAHSKAISHIYVLFINSTT